MHPRQQTAIAGSRPRQRVPSIERRSKELGCRMQTLRYASLERQAQPGLIALGIGENGQIAFIDPRWCDFNDPADVRVVELDDACGFSKCMMEHSEAFKRCRAPLCQSRFWLAADSASTGVRERSVQERRGQDGSRRPDHGTVSCLGVAKASERDHVPR